MLLYLQMIDSAEDRSKFEQIYHQYRNLMYYEAYQVLKNEQDTEDAVQSSLVKISKNIHKIGEANSPKTTGYIVTIVRNSAIDLHRKKNRRSALRLSEELGAVEYKSDEGLGKCLLQLPERYRKVLLLKHYHGYRNKEIAQLLDMTPANVARVAQRAKTRLRELCEKENVI